MAEPIDHVARFESVPAPGSFLPGQVLRDLGDALVLRLASPADADAIRGFNRVVHADPPDFDPIEGLGHWGHDLASGRHPSVAPEDFWLVEDTLRGRLASSLGLIGHRMEYDGIAFDAGQVELVGTHPDYRERGLVRLQMEALHASSRERGQRLQWISGIPYYYRKFGYDMALETDGAAVVARSSLPDAVASDPLQWRLATPDDAETIRELAHANSRRSRLSCDVPAHFWRYALATQHPDSLGRRIIHLGHDSGGAPAAVVMTAPLLHGGGLLVRAVEIGPEQSWPELSSSLLARIRASGDALAEEASPFTVARLQLGSAHPLYGVESARLRDRRRPYALFVRIEDLAGFLRLITPVLEERLARSDQARRSGALELNFYSTGLRLHLEHGKLRDIEAWQPTTEDFGHHCFPDNTFLQLLLGYRSLAELQHAFADCLPRSEAHVPWLEALLPPAPSHLIPVT